MLINIFTKFVHESNLYYFHIIAGCIKMEYTNCAEFLRPSRPRLESLDDWLKAFQVGGLSIKRAGTVVESSLSTKAKDSHFIHPSVKPFSKSVVSVLKQEQSVVKKVSFFIQIFYLKSINPPFSIKFSRLQMCCLKIH